MVLLAVSGNPRGIYWWNRGTGFFLRMTCPSRHINHFNGFPVNIMTQYVRRNYTKQQAIISRTHNPGNWHIDIHVPFSLADHITFSWHIKPNWYINSLAPGRFAWNFQVSTMQCNHSDWRLGYLFLNCPQDTFYRTLSTASQHWFR